MEHIKNIKVIKILNSRSEETIKVKVFSENFSASFSLPQGKSKGKHEAVFLSADKAKEKIENLILKKIKGEKVDFQKIDKILINLDGTKQKKKLGANSILGISVALAKLQAKIQRKPLFEFLSNFFEKKPNFSLHLLMNFVNGGVHSVGGPTFQEYLVILKSESLSKSVFLGSKIYKILGEKVNSNIGDEGGYVFGKGNSEKPLEILKGIIKNENFQKNAFLGLDLAASQFFNGKNYFVDGKKFSKNDLKNYYLKLVLKYGLIYLEDPFEENDFNSFSLLKKEVNNCVVVGDDLTVTNKERLKEAIKKQSISGLIVKPNQIGSLSETIEVINLAKKNNIKVIISHRSGETNDSFIADLAIASNAWGIKTGAPARGERVAKYNRLIEMENFKKGFYPFKGRKI